MQHDEIDDADIVVELMHGYVIDVEQVDEM